MISSSKAHVPLLLGSTLPWGLAGLLAAPLGPLHETLLFQKTETPTTVPAAGDPTFYPAAKSNFSPGYFRISPSALLSLLNHRHAPNGLAEVSQLNKELASTRHGLGHAVCAPRAPCRAGQLSSHLPGVLAADTKPPRELTSPKTAPSPTTGNLSRHHPSKGGIVQRVHRPSLCLLGQQAERAVPLQSSPWDPPKPPPPPNSLLAPPHPASLPHRCFFLRWSSVGEACFPGNQI